jgi:hypothetical protein
MRFVVFVVFLFTAFASNAQTVTGSWYGVADPVAGNASSNNYLTELVIKQKGDDIEGVFGYYFRDGYQSYYIRGKYDAKTRMVTIKNIPVSYFRNRNIDGIDCPMDFTATLLVSQVKSTLTGRFASQEKYKYTCPELRVSYALDETERNQDSVIKHSTSNTKKYWKPREEELVINTKGVVSTPAVVTTTTDSTATAVPDSAKMQATAKEIADSIAKKEMLAKLVTSFEQRKTILSKEIEIESDSVRISFYDNGDVDGDSISIFMNKVPVLTQQPLSAKSLNMYLAFDKETSVAEISMFAENLGLFPPNTALMIITDGEKKYEVFMSSNLTQNSAVRLKKKRK